MKYGWYKIRLCNISFHWRNRFVGCYFEWPLVALQVHGQIEMVVLGDFFQLTL